MTDQAHWDRLEQAFATAISLPSRERRAWVESSCSKDPAFKAELLSLLEASEESPGFLGDLADELVGPDLRRLLKDVPTDSGRISDARIGRTIDHYEVIARLGGGGMGVVYRARDIRLDRQVALKFLAPLAGGPDVQGRFVTEAKAASALDHPNICTIHEISETEGGELFIVMACYDGETVADRIKRGPLAIADALDVARQTALGLGAAHVQGVVHRDVKPANVLITETGVVKVLDFGLAKMVGESSIAGAGVVGTVAYMSPEQASGARVDGRTDVWSLGAMLYEMLYGQRAFSGDSVRGQISAILHQDPVPVGEVVSDLPSEVAVAIDRALQKDPEARYDDGNAFALALGTPAESLILPSHAKARVRRPKRPLSQLRKRVAWIAPMAIAAVAAVGLASWSGLFDRAPLLEEQGWVVLADFENLTDDPSLGPPLHQALLIGLSQSQYLNLLPRHQVRETLGWMERPATAAVTVEVAREVAVRRDIAVVAAPSVSRLDSTYLVAIQVLDAPDGRIRLSGQQVASGRDDIIPALSELAADLRQSLGEAAASVRRQGLPVQKATTASLDALKAWSQGNAVWATGDQEQAGVFYQQALELDSAFAMAHLALGQYHYWTRNDPPTGERHFETALAASDRLTRRERLSMEGVVAGYRGDYAGSVEKNSVLFDLYPEDAGAARSLGYAHLRLGQSEQAIAAYQRSLELDSLSANAWLNLATAFQSAGGPEEAIPAYQKAFEIAPAYKIATNINQEFGMAQVHVGNYAAAEEVFSWMSEGNDLQRTRGLRSTALLRMHAGRYGSAVTLLRQAVDEIDVSDDSPVSQVRNLILLAQALTLTGNTADALTRLSAAERIGEVSYVLPTFHARVGIALARFGEANRARRILAVVRERVPEANRSVWSDVQRLTGELELLDGDQGASIASFREAVAGSEDAGSLRGLARALQAAGMESEAASQLELAVARSTDFTERQDDWLQAHYELGLAREGLGDEEGAREVYRRLLEMWKAADADLALAADTRNRLAALNGVG